MKAHRCKRKEKKRMVADSRCLATLRLIFSKGYNIGLFFFALFLFIFLHIFLLQKFKLFENLLFLKNSL